MVPDRDFAVLDLPQLVWPANVSIPSRRFRMLVAANVDSLTSETMAEFARSALKQGMVYFCAWGKGCERFHDIVDDVIVATDATGPGETSEGVVMTTWHKDQSLEEALDFLATCAYPTDGLVSGSEYRLVICVGNSTWSGIARDFLKAAEFFV